MCKLIEDSLVPGNKINAHFLRGREYIAADEWSKYGGSTIRSGDAKTGRFEGGIEAGAAKKAVEFWEHYLQFL
jgi:hypothetical protein